MNEIEIAVQQESEETKDRELREDAENTEIAEEVAEEVYQDIGTLVGERVGIFNSEYPQERVDAIVERVAEIISSYVVQPEERRDWPKEYEYARTRAVSGHVVKLKECCDCCEEVGAFVYFVPATLEPVIDKAIDRHPGFGRRKRLLDMP
jgi:hypothetical protein